MSTRALEPPFRKLKVDKKWRYPKNAIMYTQSPAKSDTLTVEEARLTQMMKALGNPVRMQVVRFLSKHPQCNTGEIVDMLPLTQATH